MLKFTNNLGHNKFLSYVSPFKDLFYAKIRITRERILPLDLDRGEDHFVD